MYVEGAMRKSLGNKITLVVNSKLNHDIRSLDKLCNFTMHKNKNQSGSVSDF